MSQERMNLALLYILRWLPSGIYDQVQNCNSNLQYPWLRFTIFCLNWTGIIPLVSFIHPGLISLHKTNFDYLTFRLSAPKIWNKLSLEVNLVKSAQCKHPLQTFNSFAISRITVNPWNIDTYTCQWLQNSPFQVKMVHCWNFQQMTCSDPMLVCTSDSCLTVHKCNSHPCCIEVVLLKSDYYYYIMNWLHICFLAKQTFIYHKSLFSRPQAILFNHLWT